MVRVEMRFHPETSAEAFVLLVAAGIKVKFVRRGKDGDVISVPRKDAATARQIVNR